MSRWTTPLRVRERERVGDLDQDADRLVHRELALRERGGRGGSPVHVGHDVVEEAVGLAGVEQRQDVRVLQPGGDADLAGEALGAEGRGELGAEHLDGDLAVVLQVVGEVDGGHAALAELALDPVGGAEGTLKLVAQVAGRGTAGWSGTGESSGGSGLWVRAEGADTGRGSGPRPRPRKRKAKPDRPLASVDGTHPGD